MNDSALLDILSHAGFSTWVTVGVMFLLSIGVWALLVQKWLGNRRKRKSFSDWEVAIGVRPSLQDITRIAHGMPETPMGRVVHNAAREVEALSRIVTFESLEARSQLIAESIDRAVDAEKDLNERGMAYLAFCTATGPLIGLLGTVWGIMDAFFRIGKMGSANITVVAPGVAEALIAVFSGLLVAIPSSLGYNAAAGFNRRAESALYSLGSEVVSAFKRGDLQALENARG
jgi:biopolymer transport protein TolQ